MARSASNREIWITRSHLAALGVATLFIAVLAFMVGYQAGGGGVAEVPTDVADGVIPDADQDGALEALLREVEYAQDTIAPDGSVSAGDSTSAADEVQFVRTLGSGEGGDEPVVPMGAGRADDAVLVQAGPEPAPEGPVPGDGLPTDGWAVQVASFPTATEADERIIELREQGLAAYRVAALVDGQTWHRVRVGGFESRSAAEAARSELMATLGEPYLLVAEAP